MAGPQDMAPELVGYAVTLRPYDRADLPALLRNRQRPWPWRDALLMDLLAEELR